MHRSIKSDLKNIVLKGRIAKSVTINSKPLNHEDFWCDRFEVLQAQISVIILISKISQSCQFTSHFGLQSQPT